jgi:hypothetical protein
MVERYDENMLLGYVEGDLSAGDRAVVEQWVRQDPRLGRLLEQISHDRAAVRQLPDPPAPESIAQELDGQIERLMLMDDTRQPIAGEALRQRFALRKWLVGASIAALFAVASAVVIWSLVIDKPRLPSGPVVAVAPAAGAESERIAAGGAGGAAMMKSTDSAAAAPAAGPTPVASPTAAPDAVKPQAIATVLIPQPASDDAPRALNRSAGGAVLAPAPRRAPESTVDPVEELSIAPHLSDRFVLTVQSDDVQAVLVRIAALNADAARAESVDIWQAPSARRLLIVPASDLRETIAKLAWEFGEQRVALSRAPGPPPNWPSLVPDYSTMLNRQVDRLLESERAWVRLPVRIEPPMPMLKKAQAPDEPSGPDSPARPK